MTLRTRKDQLYKLLTAKVKTLRDDKFFMGCTIGSGVLLLLGIIMKISLLNKYITESTSLNISNIFFSAATTLLVAAILQYLQMITLDENLCDSIKKTLINEIENFKQLNSIFTPYKVYWHKFDNNRADKSIDECIGNSFIYRFYGTTAKYLLGVRLPRLLNTTLNDIYPPKIVRFELLLQDPVDIGAEQANQDGHCKTPEQLKAEVVESILRAKYINSKNNNIKFTIRLHAEDPHFRLELVGNDDLFFSFRNRKRIVVPRGETKGSAPMAHYKKELNEEVYSHYQHIWNDVWESRYAQEREFHIENTVNLQDFIKNLISKKFIETKFLEKAIESISNISISEDDQFKEYVKIGNILSSQKEVK